MNFTTMIRVILAFGFLFWDSNVAFSQTIREKAKIEILAAEANFQQMAKDSGVAVAFEHFAAPDAVINRNDLLLVGLDAIVTYMKNSKVTSVKLLWTPDFVEASDDGTLGYTYGRYTFSAIDPEGKPISSTGIFHTVWRRQPNGEWKYVWD
jgi:ketosteroid isomerase-like protein